MRRRSNNNLLGATGGGGGGGGIIVSDGFDDTAGINITSHTPDIGTSWSYSPFNQVANGITIDGDGSSIEFSTASTTTWAMASPDPDPTSADTSIVTQIEYLQATSNGFAGVTLGCRMSDQVSRNGYAVELFSGVFQILRFNNGSASVLGTWTPSGFTLGSSWSVEFLVVGDSLKLIVESTERISVTDSQHTSAGLTFIGGRTRSSGQITCSSFSVEDL